MGTRFAETGTDRLIAETLASDGDEFVERLRAIHHRCTEEIFLKAVLLVRETYPRRQARGFDILAGLGNGISRPFAATTAPILLGHAQSEPRAPARGWLTVYSRWPPDYAGRIGTITLRLK